MSETIRQLQIAHEALEAAKSLATADSIRDNDLIAKLEQDIGDLETTIATLQGRQSEDL